MISNELLSAILGKNCIVNQIIDTNIQYQAWTTVSEEDSKRFNPPLESGYGLFEHINIYELAHKAKQWALNNGYFSITMFRADELFSCDIGPTSSGEWDRWEECFIEETENEAIFKACQFILDEQKGQNLND
jgi:hypothetical protein